MTNDNHKKALARSNTYGWSLKAAGDNSVDLLGYIFKVNSILDSARLGQEIAELVAGCDETEGGYAQITLRGWQVEVTMSTPGGAWGSRAQEQLAASIDRLSKSR